MSSPTITHTNITRQNEIKDCKVRILGSQPATLNVWKRTLRSIGIRGIYDYETYSNDTIWHKWFVCMKYFFYGSCKTLSPCSDKNICQASLRGSTWRGQPTNQLRFYIIYLSPRFIQSFVVTTISTGNIIFLETLSHEFLSVFFETNSRQPWTFS